MKFTTPFNLFATFAFSALSLNHSSLVSANNKNDDSSLPTTPTTSDHPSEDLSAPMPDQHRAGHLSLLGLDPRIPLTKAEAAFLEATIRDVFNTIHEEEGIDLVADAVAIDGKFVEDTKSIESTDNLRGSDRKLRPLSDRERCPDKGETREYCCNIEFYVDYCELCDDPPVKHADDDDVFYQYRDDDYYAKVIATAASTSAPTEIESYNDPTMRKLHRSPFSRFHHVKHVRFGGW